ncbi:DMT family transporter [Leptospira sp. 96542]|nr:DMT family transporter [Leptospira sp. 96542]
MIGDPKKGYFFVFLTGVFFAIEVIGFKEIFRRYKLNPEIAALYGVSACFVIVTGYILFSKTSRTKVVTTVKRDGYILFLGTLSNAFGILLYYLALKQTDLGPAAILIKTTVLYNVILGTVLLGEKLRRLEILGIVISLLGIYLVSTLNGQISIYSSFLILTSAFFFAIQSFMIKKYVPQIFGLEYAYLRLLLLSIFFILYSKSVGSLVFIDPKLILILGLFSFLGYFLGRAFYFEAHNHLPMSKLNATLLIEPIFLMFIGILFMNEPLDPKKIFGAILILFGLYLIVFHHRNKKV